MAAFGTVNDRTTSVPSIVNSYSDTTQPIADKSAGSLISGVSDLFEGAVNATKGVFMKDIETKVQAGYDAENDKNGVSRAALQARLGQKVTGAKVDSEEPGGSDPVPDPDGGATAPGSGNPLDANASTELPPAAQGMLDRASRMERANAAGRLTPTDYNAKMEALVRQVRAEYPQFRDEIDQTVSRITGITPANALRASMLRDQNTALRQAQSADSKIDAFLLSHSDALPAGWEGMDKHALVVKVQNVMRVRGDVAASTAQLGLEDKTTGVNQQRALDVSVDPAQSVVRQELTRIMNPTGMSVTELEQRAKNMSREEKQAGLVKLQQAVLQVPNKVDEYLATVPLGATRSIGAMMGPDNVAKLKKQVLAPVDDYVKQWTEGNFGVLHSDDTANNLIMSSTQGKLLGNARYAATAAMNKDIGGAGVALILGHVNKDGSSGVSELAQLASDTTRLEAANPKAKAEGGAYSGPNLGGQRLKAVLKEQHQTDPEIRASAFKKQITDFTDSVTNEKMPMAARVSLAKSIIRDASYFHDYFSPGSGQAAAYSLMTTPQMSDAMMKISQSNPDIKKQWGQYMEDNFLYVTRLGQQSVDSLTKDKNVKVTQDPNSGLFVVDHSDSSPYKHAVDRRMVAEGDQNLKAYQARAEDLNKAYSNLAYWYKLNGQDAGKQLLKMSHSLNLDVNAPKDDWWGKVITATKSALVQAGSINHNAAYDETMEDWADPVIGHKPSTK